MTKQETKKISPNRVEDLVKELNNEPKVNIKNINSEKEAFRGKINGNLIVVYRTGTVVYHYNPLTISILKKYPIVTVKNKKSKIKDRSLNVKLQPSQCQILAKLLDSDSSFKEVQSTEENIAKVFEKGAKKLIIYHKGSVFSPNGYSIFSSIILEVIKQTPLYENFDLVIGQDEAGKGEFFGPMVIASVVLTGEQQIKLQLEGIKDSKTVSRNGIDPLADIVKNNSIAKKVIKIGARTFNQRFKEMKSENKNLNDLLAWGHSKALSEVLKQLKQKNLDNKKILLIIDEFDRIKTDSRIKDSLTPNITVIQKPSAEQISISVAAASILAKFIRNNEMAKLQDKVPIPIKISNLNQIWYQSNADDIIRYEYVKSAKERGTLVTRQLVKGKEAQVYLDMIIKRIESHDLDFKEKFPKNASNIGKLLSAFANHDGGDIFFGINSKNNMLTGVIDVQQLEERISGVREKCDPPPSIEYNIYEISNGIVILQTHVSKSKKPVASDGKYYYREKNSSITRILTTKEIEGMLKT